MNNCNFDFEIREINPALGQIFNTSNEEKNYSLVIQNCPKPKSLKYPNKKRARRIWKKWENRFGVKSIYVPNVEMSLTQGEKGNFCYKFTVKKEQE